MARRNKTDRPTPGGGPSFKPGLREGAKSRKAEKTELRPPYLGPDGDTSPDDIDLYQEEDG